MAPARSSRAHAVLVVLALVTAAGCSADESADRVPTVSVDVSVSTIEVSPAAPDAAVPSAEVAELVDGVPVAEQCPNSAQTLAELDSPIVIGTAAPLTGSPGAVSAAFVAGQQAYIDYVNAMRGGVDGRTLELLATDHRADVDMARGAAAGLVAAGADIVSGVVGTDANRVMAGVLNGLCVPQLWGVSGSAEWGQVEATPWTTVVSVPHEIELAAWVSAWPSVIVSELAPAAPTVGLIITDDADGASFAAAAREAAEAAGWDLVGEALLPATAETITAEQLNGALAGEPDLVIAAPIGVQCVAVLGAVTEMQASPIVYLASECANPLLLAAAGASAEGVYTSTNLRAVVGDASSGDAAVQRYLAEFAASGSEADPAGGAALGWLSMQATVATLDAAAAAGELSRHGIIAAARRLDVGPELLRRGTRLHLDVDDAFAAEATAIVRWNGQRFIDVGDVYDAEGTLGVVQLS